MKIHYKHCPVCNSGNIHFVLSVKDFTVSEEAFPVWQCDDCTLRFTQEVPDAESINPYYKSDDYISHTNTSKGLINQLYQKVRKRTMRQKAEIVEKLTGLQQGKLLDIGAGVGTFLSTMKNRNWNVTGLEPDRDARILANKLYAINLLSSDKLFDFEKNHFDAITMWHVLEHVHDLHHYIAQLKAIVKDEGKIFIAVPNYTSKDASIYQQYWAAYDVPRHLYHFSPKSIDRLMQQHGLRVINLLPMWYDSFYISMLSSKYKYGKTQYISSAYNGLRSNQQAMQDVDKCSSVIYVIEKT